MAGAENIQLVELDKKLLESIDARRKSCNAKEAIARSRLAFQAARDRQVPSDSTTKAPGTPMPVTEESQSAVPANSESEDLQFLSQWDDPTAQLPRNGIDEDDPTTIPEEISMDEEEDSTKFDEAKIRYDMNFQPTLVDMVKFEAANLEEEARQRRVASRKAREEQEKEEEALFVTEDDENTTSTDLPQQSSTFQAESSKTKAPKKPRRKQQHKLSAEEKRKSMKLGLDIALGHKNDWMSVDIGSILSADVVKEAHASSSLQAIPDVGHRNKEKALAQMIASIPNADTKETVSDKNIVIRASRKFTSRPKHDKSKGLWKIKGLRTMLYHYQRERENSETAPYGGLLCDMMGFGKTIQALANIVDGRPDDDHDPVKTTLIIVPSHLVTHWKTQIIKHCEEEAVGDVGEHHTKNRVVGLTPVSTTRILQKYGIVITTYEEVRKSYPPSKPPKELADPQKIKNWWTERFENEIGPLHRMKFLRIILDEGHVIKNHLSSVSIAVRALTAKYKWVLTGTPVLNYIDEFYPHFDFLGVPRTGRYDDFVKLYCQDETAQERLTNMLRAILFRRTHASRLFTLPIIKLPDIKEQIIEVDFCDVERAIYTEIQELFFDNINGLVSVHNAKVAQYRCFLTMILKLRMFSSHLLTAQDIVKNLLTNRLMKRLHAIVKDDTEAPSASKKILNCLVALRKEISLPERTSKGKGAEQPLVVLEGDQKKLEKAFFDHMDELHENEDWGERLQRTNCPNCKYLPEEPVVTNCRHLYCEECYCMLNEDEEHRKMCSSCQVPITEAAYCGSFENIDESPTAASDKEPSKKKTKKEKKKKRTTGMFKRSLPKSREEVDDSEDDADEKVDWIEAAQGNMPGAKLAKLTEITSAWIAENPEVKIVVFTQFLGFVQLVADMCEKQDWEYTCLTGKMSFPDRQESMESFKNEPETRVLIASLRAGGTGLDFSMACKCILVDLWWNEGVQQQAICRLLRIGQQNDVEVVKLLVKETIDDYMHKLQTDKTSEITDIMGEDVLSKRDPVRKLLEMFATVTDSELGGVIVKRKP
ncbi:SNF2 family N-terminal domain-containing protein [Aspergillus ambiguus]|uniref:putative SNF2 family helicase n=1 Tax=Aspergillus ambiguus TaxID=176160 RepID=UPI003CCDBB95